MIVAGIGCRKGVDVEAVLGAIAAGLDRHGLDAAQLHALASAPVKAAEPALQLAAGRLGLPLVIVTQQALERARTSSRSQASLSHAGTASVSEAAALALAGPGSGLLGPRLVSGAVTCAIAATDHHHAGHHRAGKKETP